MKKLQLKICEPRFTAVPIERFASTNDATLFSV